MTDQFIYQTFDRTDGNWELAIITNGRVLVPIRLIEDRGYIQTHRIISNDGCDVTDDVREARNFAENYLCEYVHTV